MRIHNASSLNSYTLPLIIPVSAHIQVPLNFVASMIGICDNGHQHDNVSLRQKKIAMKSVTLIFAHFSYTLGQAIQLKMNILLRKNKSEIRYCSYI